MNEQANRSWILDRRAFLRLGAGAGLCSIFMGWNHPAYAAIFNPQATSGTAVTPRSSARNCILIMLRGGNSHTDTFDLKLGDWTPDSLGGSQNVAGYLWPNGYLPKLGQRANKFSIIRSLQHQEVVHERAEYYTETGRRLNPGLRDEIPHIGSIIALENEEKRISTDIFPGFMLFSFGAYSSNGFLNANFAPFMVDNPGGGIENLQPFDGLSAFDRRRTTLELLNNINSGQTNTTRQTSPIFQQQAEKLMHDPATTQTFSVTSSDRTRYGNTYFGQGLAVARNVLKANRGTRFIEVDHYGWDQHINIYGDGAYDLPSLCNELDLGLSALLDDLAATPGVTAGKSLLDETMVITMGEFGRTVGPLNPSRGRDHYPYVFSGLFAGGGIKGGRLIGATDETGGGVKDFGWSHDRPIHLPDVITTIYSALGIDWTKTVTNTPSGRVFRYADPEAVGDSDSYDISPLF